MPRNGGSDADDDGAKRENAASERAPLLSSFRRNDTNGSNHSVHFGDDSTRSISRVLMRSASAYVENFTKSERDRALRKPGVGEAAFLICDAVLGSVDNPAEGAYNPYQNPGDYWHNAISISCRRICSLSWVRWLHYTCIWMMVLLSFIEPPAWCFNTPGLPDYHDKFTAGYCPRIMELYGPPADDPDSVVDVQYYPNATVFLLDRHQAIIAEYVLIAFLILVVLLRIGRDGMSLKRYLRQGLAVRSRAVEIVAIACLLLSLTIQTVTEGYHTRYGSCCDRKQILETCRFIS